MREHCYLEYSVCGHYGTPGQNKRHRGQRGAFTLQADGRPTRCWLLGGFGGYAVSCLDSWDPGWTQEDDHTRKK